MCKSVKWQIHLNTGKFFSWLEDGIWHKNPNMAVIKCQNQGFKMVVHELMSDITVAISFFKYSSHILPLKSISLLQLFSHALRIYANQ